MHVDVTPLRRKPVQQRSTQRLERMLDACAALLCEVGYDAMTTTLIAERAGVAVGSLYQFFPDKRAVVQALTLRNLELFLSTVVDQLTDNTPAHWSDVVDAAFDVYLAMHRDVPGFRKVHFGDAIDTRLLDEGKDNNAVIAERLSHLIGQYCELPVTAVQLPMTIAIESADALLRLAFRQAPDGDPNVITEAKTLVRDYLSARFGHSKV